MIPPTPALQVLAVGPACTVQDLGRSGFARLGVTGSGAFDRAGLRLANRLVGNDEGAAGLELLLGGLRVRALVHLQVAVTGRACPIDVNGRQVSLDGPLHLSPDDILTVGRPTAGLRLQVAVRGGIAVPAVLGSRSYDSLSGLGPTPLRVGDVLPVGAEPARLPDVDIAPIATAHGPLRARISPGPRSDWVTPTALDRLVSTVWRVSADSDRIGVRLLGATLERSNPAELPSEPLRRGAVQVTGSGLPIVFGPDHPVTGGYPVVAIVHPADTDGFAHLRPGDPLLLQWEREERMLSPGWTNQDDTPPSIP